MFQNSQLPYEFISSNLGLILISPTFLFGIKMGKERLGEKESSTSVSLCILGSSLA